MKFIIGVVLTVAVINSAVQGRFNDKRLTKRQNTACVLTYAKLSSDERDCIPLDSDSFSIDQLETLCSSDICITAAKKLLKGCKVNICPSVCRMIMSDRARSEA